MASSRSVENSKVATPTRSAATGGSAALPPLHSSPSKSGAGARYSKDRLRDIQAQADRFTHTVRTLSDDLKAMEARHREMVSKSLSAMSNTPIVVPSPSRARDTKTAEPFALFSMVCHRLPSHSPSLHARLTHLCSLLLSCRRAA